MINDIRSHFSGIRPSHCKLGKIHIHEDIWIMTKGGRILVHGGLSSVRTYASVRTSDFHLESEYCSLTMRHRYDAAASRGGSWRSLRILLLASYSR